LATSGFIITPKLGVCEAGSSLRAAARWNTRSAPSSHGWGYTHFLTRTLEHVSTEMSLHVLAYNLKRVMRIMGVVPLMEAIAE
jgi:hypothetical protein